jgi:hypothetical protein
MDFDSRPVHLEWGLHSCFVDVYKVQRSHMKQPGPSPYLYKTRRNQTPNIQATGIEIHKHPPSDHTHVPTLGLTCFCQSTTRQNASMHRDSLQTGPFTTGQPHPHFFRHRVVIPLASSIREVLVAGALRNIILAPFLEVHPDCYPVIQPRHMQYMSLRSPHRLTTWVPLMPFLLRQSESLQVLGRHAQCYIIHCPQP